ncbi:diguanylate cyclase [Pseudomonas aeruginosa]
MDERASKPPDLLPLSREDLEKTLRYALEIVSDGIWDWNIATNQVSRSAGWYLMLGYPPHSLPESVETWKSIIHPEDYPRVMASFQAYLDGESPEYCEEYRCRTYSGDYLWISDRGRFVEFDERGEPRRMIGAHHEIHQRKLVELELQQRNEELFDWNLRLEELVAERTEALHRVNQALASKMAEAQRLSEIDPLTELYNRRKFEQCLHHEWMRRQRHGRATALVMIDVDHFKRINDLFGHSTGDRVLVAFGRLVASELREVDVLARWGGEEFILLLPETGLEAAAALAERLRQRVRSQSFEMGERLTASFGVGVLNDGESLDLLLCRVDDALYRAKQRRDCVACC